MRILIRFNLIIVFIFSSHQLWSDDLYDATVAEREGNVEKAVQLFDHWLFENREDDRFSDILFHCASIIEKVEDTLEFLFKYEKSIREENRQKYYLLIARTYELLFQYENASMYYGIASDKPSGNKNFQIYLKHLQLNYQMGIIPDETELNNILLSNVSSAVYVDALIFKAELFKYNGEFERAISLLLQSDRKETHPEIYFALWDIYLLENNSSAAAAILDTMKMSFPDSIELSLMEGKIKELPRLSDFFLKKSESVDLSYIQIGSFADVENINAISDILKSLGFDFFYIKESDMTKIIVTASMPTDQLLSELKTKGLDGFPIGYP